jgi:hypothetical protein
MSAWFRVDVVRLHEGYPVIVRPYVDAVYAEHIGVAARVAFERNWFRPGEDVGVHAVTGQRNQKDVMANARRTAQIHEMYELEMKFR